MSGRRRSSRDSSLEISLGPSESQLIVFEPSSSKLVSHHPMLSHLIANIEGFALETLSGQLRGRLQHVDGTDRTVTLDRLIDFKNRDDLRYFAGTITYLQTF